MSQYSHPRFSRSGSSKASSQPIDGNLSQDILARKAGSDTLRLGTRLYTHTPSFCKRARNISNTFARLVPALLETLLPP